MNSDSNPILTLVWTFGLMSLFAVGGANAAIPEMHRVAVDVRHWMTDKQFANVFAISQMAPGPNVLIVTLIGYSVAGVAGALVATLAMCGPTAVVAYYVSRLLTRSSHSRWPAIIQAALVPLSIGLMGTSGLILALASDRNWTSALVTALSAVLAVATRLNPLWMLLAGGLFGFRWRYLTKIGRQCYGRRTMPAEEEKRAVNRPWRGRVWLVQWANRLINRRRRQRSGILPRQSLF
jgi:chromate transporter